MKMHLRLLALGLATLSVVKVAAVENVLPGPGAGPVAEDASSTSGPSSTSSMVVEHGSAGGHQEAKRTAPEPNVQSKDLGRPPRHGERRGRTPDQPRGMSSSFDRKSLFRQGGQPPPRYSQDMSSHIQSLKSGLSEQSLFRPDVSRAPKSAEQPKLQLSPQTRRLQESAKKIRDQEKLKKAQKDIPQLPESPKPHISPHMRHMLGIGQKLKGQEKAQQRRSGLPRPAKGHDRYLSEQLQRHDHMAEDNERLRRFKDTEKNIPMGARAELENIIKQKGSAIQRTREHIMNIHAEHRGAGKGLTPKLSMPNLRQTSSEARGPPRLHRRGNGSDRFELPSLAGGTTRRSQRERRGFGSRRGSDIEGKSKLSRRDIFKKSHEIHPTADPFDESEQARATPLQKETKSQHGHSTAKGMRKFHALRDSSEVSKGQKDSGALPPHPPQGHGTTNVDKMWHDLQHSTQRGWEKDPKGAPFGEVGQQMEALRKAKIKTGNLEFALSGARIHAPSKTPGLMAKKQEAEKGLEGLEKAFQELNERRRKTAVRPTVL